MEQLKQMLEAYRNGDRPMPTYAELAAIAHPDTPVAQMEPGMMLNEYMKNNRRSGANSWSVKRIECMDGFTMSVQGSEYNYSSPREHCADFYIKVEIGFPSAAPQAFIDYAEQQETPTDTVYGYVPVDLVEQEIALHGGIKGPVA